jgi:hypothetical protein
MTQADHSQLPIDVDAVLADPKAYFDQPMAVVTHPGLPAAFKLKVLRQWELDARLLATAEAEGMGGGEDSMLSRVSRALRALEEESGMKTYETETATHSTIGDAARNVASGIGEAASQVQHAAAQTREGVAEVRQFIRAQPITAALLIFGFGYLSGRVASAFRADTR